MFITTIPKYLNFAMFSVVFLLFLQYCRAALDVNIVIQFSKILLHLQDKTCSFSNRRHICIPSVNHLVIYSERWKGPSLKDLPENNTTVSKTVYCCLVLQHLCHFSDQNSSKISISCGPKGLSLCLIKLLFENNQKTHNTLRRLESFQMQHKNPIDFHVQKARLPFNRKKCCFAFFQQVSFHCAWCSFADSILLCNCILQEINIKSVLKLDLSLYHKFCISGGLFS